MTVGSLFAGIGGFDLGFERAGFEIKWQVEIDPFCRKVLEKHWPAAKRYDDVRECCGNLLRVSHADHRCAECGRAHWLPWVDVICGGFPCQDISFAGGGEGLDGERSGLWREYKRIISELRPNYVVVENVAALLQRGIDRVLGDLADLGYDAEWDCLPAAVFGADHERERIFIVAYPVCEGLPVRGQAGAHSQDARIFGEGFRSAFRAAPEGLECRGASQWGGSVHGIPDRVHRIKGLGNAVYPPIAEWIAHRIKEADASVMRDAERAVHNPVSAAPK